MDQKVATKIGKYEIVAELGQGGMGVVYKARDPFIGRLVALKTITPELVSDPEILKRFYREAQSAGTLQHPNIVTIYDLGEADGRPYIAMEFVEGESLQAIINRRARIPLAAKLKLVQQFCEGLGHAHKHGFVHRDVKPANILVTNDGNVKVVDFGIVHLESTNLTKTGMFLGTIHYASPEQINDGRVDARSDLWSVACVVYEFIAYKKAFDGSNIAAIIARVLSTEPEPLSRCCPGVPVEIDSVISKGLSKNIDERYQSLDELLGDLLPIARGLQQSFIGDLLTEARDLREKGDYAAAQEKVRAVLILDNTHGEAKRLHSDIATEIHRITPVTKAKKLVAEAEQAFSRGEYAEAIRMLGEAETLNPADTIARSLKSKAVQEQDRVRQLRDALNSGQRAMKSGDLTGAEQELHRVLQLDRDNPQAAELLEQIRQDRLTRERDFRLKEALWQTDNLVNEGKYEDAQASLLELQQDFPQSEEIQLKLQVLDPLVRSRKLFHEGEQAFNQGEYAEAVRALTEALELNPRDTEAHALKDRAQQERDRLRQIREALSSGQRALRQGDMGSAEQELHRVLQLDSTNAQANSMIGQIRQLQAAREREVRFREALQQSDALVAAGKFDEAQRSLFDLQQEFPDSTEIDQKLLDLDQKMKLGKLVAEGQHAFDQGEFGEAVRILTEAQELAPGDGQVRDLKVRAVQERDRLRQVREAIASGQRALRQGDINAAEREIQRALQLDPANTQASNLLAQVQRDRQARERELLLKAGLKETDSLLAAKKLDEAHRKLTELQAAHPDSDEVQQKLLTVNQRKAEAAAPPPPPPAPVSSATGPKPALRPTPVNEAARLAHSQEELVRALGPSRTADASAPTKVPPVAPPAVQGSSPKLPVVEPPVPPPLAEQPSALGGATAMMRTFKSAPPVEQQPADILAPPLLPPMPTPPVQTAAPAPVAPQVEPKKPAPAVPAPRVTPAPAVTAKKEPSKMSPMILGAIGVLVIILAVGAFMFLHHPSSGGGSADEVQIETDAKALQDKGDFQGALGKWQELLAKNGSLKGEAQSAIADMNQKIQQQETTVFNQAKADQDAKKWDDAIAGYNKVVAMNGSKKDEALGAISTVETLKHGGDPTKAEKTAFQDASNAMKRKEYAKAKASFQQVVALNIPDSTLLPQAQTHLAELDQLVKDQAEFNAAVQAQNKADLQGALSQFTNIANKPGAYQAEAKARIPGLTDLINKGATDKVAQQEFNTAVQAENANDLNGALDKFKAIAGKPGTYQKEAASHVQEITDKQNAAAAKGKFDAAVQAENSNHLDDALSQFSALLSVPDFKDQAQTHIQQIKDKRAAAAAAADAAAVQAKFDDAVKKENSNDLNDLKGAADEFKSLLAKRPDAADQYAAVVAKIAALGTPHPKPVGGGGGGGGEGSTPGPAHAVVQLVAPGEYEKWTGPVNKGQTIPANSIEGGLKPLSALTVPPVADARAGQFVTFMINISPEGNVTPTRSLEDDSGIGPKVMPASKSWKFAPPMVKGKPVSTSISVKVSF